jgi:hypothetical protein
VYRKSDTYRAALQEIEQFEKELEAQEHEREQARQEMPKKNYTIPFYDQVIVLTRRQFLIMYGDKQTLVGKWCILVFQALIVGSLFYNLPPTRFVDMSTEG